MSHRTLSPRLATDVARLSGALLLAASTATAQYVRQEEFGGQTTEFYGYAVANVGDVDSDGIDDFAVGARGYAAGHGSFNGRVDLFSGASGAMIRSHFGVSPNDQLGFAVAGASDIDGDGVPDYVAGAIGYSTKKTNLGKVYAWSGATGAEIWTYSGAIASGFLGRSLAGLGDVDGDGRSDVLVGTSIHEIFIVGAAGNTIRHVADADFFGNTVAGCGDLDGDGVRDYLVGKNLADQPVPFLQDCGAVIAFSGATGATIRVHYGSHAGDQLGWGLGGLSDIDSDGVDDYLLGSLAAGVNGVYSGIAVVVSGATGTVLREQLGVAAGDFYGTSLAGIGDANRDGVDDYLVGATGTYGGRGSVTLYSGANGAYLYEWKGSASSSTTADYGKSLATGDWNGDGLADLVVGAPHDDSATLNDVGRVEVSLTCPAWNEEYGAGWPGYLGIPHVTAISQPVVGTTMTAQIDNSAHANTTAFLFVGVSKLSIPLKNSGTLLVDPLQTIVLALPSHGLTLDADIPDDATLYNADFFVQVVEFDARASKGLSFTPGLQLRCGWLWP